ncbi:MAG: CdaR family protein [Mucilaginibacter sp.]|jgi:YbbR domain-containing protein
MALIKLSATERRRLSAFFTCLVLAILAWIFTTFSSTFKYSVRVALSYKNAPQKKAFHALQADTINATLQGTGWQMLFSRMSAVNRVVTVDLRTLDSRDYVVLTSQLKNINDKKEFDQQIISFDPDTLYFDFSGRKVKKVPVKLLSGISFQRQFSQSGNIAINPPEVTISGPDNVIDRIKYWPTDSLLVDSVDETVRTTVNLQAVREGNLSIYPKAVQVKVPVDEYTEKTLQIPVKLINNHEFYNVKIFPQKVSVTFTTSLNRYPEMDEDFFEASADLDLWRERGYNTLPVKLSRVPAFCKIVKIEPQNIDFIIRK